MNTPLVKVIVYEFVKEKLLESSSTEKYTENIFCIAALHEVIWLLRKITLPNLKVRKGYLQE